MFKLVSSQVIKRVFIFWPFLAHVTNDDGLRDVENDMDNAPYFVQNFTQCGMLQCNLGQLSTLLSGQFLWELLQLPVHASAAVSFRGHIKNVRCMIKSKERWNLIF